MQVRSRFGQRRSPAHGGQVHVRTRPLGQENFFLTSCGSCESAFSYKCLLNRVNAWLDRCSDKLGRPAGTISDKNGRFREILGSNIYSYYQGSSYRKSMWYQCGPILSGSADQAQKILCNLSLNLEKTHPTLEFLFFDTVICTNKFCLSLFFSCYKSHFETTSEHNKK